MDCNSGNLLANGVFECPDEGTQFIRRNSETQQLQCGARARDNPASPQVLSMFVPDPFEAIPNEAY